MTNADLDRWAWEAMRRGELPQDAALALIAEVRRLWAEQAQTRPPPRPRPQPAPIPR